MITTLAIVSTEFDATPIVIASGEVDMATAAGLATALSDAVPAAGTLIANLTGIEFMDSSGLHALAKVQREADAKRSRLLIVPSPEVAYMIEIAGASGSFELIPAMSDALVLSHAAV